MNLSKKKLPTPFDFETGYIADSLVLYKKEQYICADVFRATGTTFIRLIPMRNSSDFIAGGYVPGLYITAQELSV